MNHHEPEPIGRLSATVADEAASRTKPPEDDREKEEHIRRMHAWNELAHRIGPRHWGCRLSGFETQSEAQRQAIEAAEQMAANIEAHIKAGRNFLAYGPCGTGKDHLMTALLFEAISQTGCSVAWHYGADLFGELRDRISKDLPEQAFLKALAARDVLAISDPITAGEPLTRFQRSFLQRVVDHRYRSRRGTWLTLNVANANEAGDLLGMPTLDRLMQDRVSIHCDWKSHRRAKRASAE